MDFAKILGSLRKIVDIVKVVAPFVPAGGLVTAGIEIAENLLNRKDDADIVLTSNDEDELKQIIEDLHEVNTGLNEEIKNS